MAGIIKIKYIISYFFYLYVVILLDVSTPQFNLMSGDVAIYCSMWGFNMTMW